jgi:periplasmic protein CpxP/Spy
MNRVRRITLATLAGGLAAGIGFKTFARGGGHEMHLDRMLKHLYVELDATEAQKAKLEAIAKQAAKDLLPMRDNLRAGRGQAIELLTQERVDPNAIEALRARQLQLADQASRRLTQAIAEAADVLTPAQRKELAAHVARRRWGHG